MRICDICEEKGAIYKTSSVINTKGNYKELELCGTCWRELQKRRDDYALQAYEETVRAMKGEIPRKSHWWNWFCWRGE